MRYKYQGTFKDGNGRVVGSATTSDGNPGVISVYEAGGVVPANVYATGVGGVAVNSVETDTHGHFYFWVDDDDYDLSQTFKIILSHADFQSKTYDDIKMLFNDYYALPVFMVNISTADSTYVVAPFMGTIYKIYSVITGTIATADAVITTAINGVDVTGGVITITQIGSAAGDVDECNPTALNIIAPGDVITFTSNGASTNVVRAFFTVLMERNA